jgi:hypothetical protein
MCIFILKVYNNYYLIPTKRTIFFYYILNVKKTVKKKK